MLADDFPLCVAVRRTTSYEVVDFLLLHSLLGSLVHPSARRDCHSATIGGHGAVVLLASASSRRLASSIHNLQYPITMAFLDGVAERWSSVHWLGC